MTKYTVIYNEAGQFYNIMAVIEGHHEELSLLSRTLHLEAEDVHEVYVRAAKILAEKAQRKAEEV